MTSGLIVPVIERAWQKFDKDEIGQRFRIYDIMRTNICTEIQVAVMFGYGAFVSPEEFTSVYKTDLSSEYKHYTKLMNVINTPDDCVINFTYTLIHETAGTQSSAQEIVLAWAICNLERLTVTEDISLDERYARTMKLSAVVGAMNKVTSKIRAKASDALTLCIADYLSKKNRVVESPVASLPPVDDTMGITLLIQSLTDTVPETMVEYKPGNKGIPQNWDPNTPILVGNCVGIIVGWHRIHQIEKLFNSRVKAYTPITSKDVEFDPVEIPDGMVGWSSATNGAIPVNWSLSIPVWLGGNNFVCLKDESEDSIREFFDKYVKGYTFSFAEKTGSDVEIPKGMTDWRYAYGIPKDWDFSQPVLVEGKLIILDEMTPEQYKFLFDNQVMAYTPLKEEKADSQHSNMARDDQKE